MYKRLTSWGENDALWKTSSSREWITENTLREEGAREAMRKQSKDTGLEEGNTRTQRPVYGKEISPGKSSKE